MTESKAEAASQRHRELLALNPELEVEFKKKVQEVKKKNRGGKVSTSRSWCSSWGIQDV